MHLKLVIIIVFCLFSSHFFGQFHLIWTNENEDFTFLKDKELIKVQFNMDSLTIVNKSLKNTVDLTIEKSKEEFYNDFKTTFVKCFIKESKKHFSIVDSMNTFNYILRITPLKFYGESINYSGEIVNGHLMSPQTSIYFKGNYLFEFFKKDIQKPERSFKLTNLTNAGPIRTYLTYGYLGNLKRAYIKDMGLQKAIIIQSKRAGIESVKYIKKLKK